MSDMVRDHEKAVKEFERESTSGKDPDLKAFAAKTLPTLQDHLKMAKETQSKLGAGTN
jgi:putative membrane protein